ncbi:hypothetical protein IM40_04395 [Candidatus Paracaedimonas acanthamoebae]|nr:hypothetical protein IM40_04395 [Candidatus Paracaedimonas acanthamoebae]
MSIRILYLWVSVLLSISFGYTSDITLESIHEEELTRNLKGKIEYALLNYKEKIQSKTSPRCKTFAEAHALTLIALKSSMESAFFLPKTALTPRIKSTLEDLKKDYEISPSFSIQSDQLMRLLNSIPHTKKMRKRLGVARDTAKVFEDTLSYINTIFKSKFLGYSEEAYAKAAQVYIALLQWRENSCKTPGHMELNTFYKEEFINNVLKSIDRTGGINFVLFVCPPVNFSSLNSENPEEYFLVSARESLLSKHVPHLETLVEEFLSPTQVPVTFLLAIGDSDEDDYIWPALGRPTGLIEEKLNHRRIKLASNIATYISQYLPSAKIAIHSLHGNGGKNADKKIYEEISLNYREYFSDSDIDTEATRMLQLWAKGSYYGGLPSPTDETLSKIIAAKFGAYAVHGIIARKLAPFSFLCQTEFPPKLRTDMLNAGIKCQKDEEFSVVYLLGDKGKSKGQVIRNPSA